MKFNPNSVFYRPTEEEKEYISTISHRHDPDVKVEGCLRFYGKVDVSKLAIADSNLDFEMDLDNGVVRSDIQPNNDYQCSGEKDEEIPTNEIFGLQFVDRLASRDKNYNPLGWKEVQSRLGLDANFNPLPSEE